MRKHKTWINMVAMLTLLTGFAPGSIIASLFAKSCQMPCCIGKLVHQAVDPVCNKGCKSKQGHQPKAAHSVDEIQPEQCQCKIGPIPTTPQPDVIANSTSTSNLQSLVADVPAQQSLKLSLVELSRDLGIFGSDAGPPASRPNYAFFGRAPPAA